MPQHLVRDGGQCFGAGRPVGGRVDDELVVPAGVGERVVEHGESARDVDGSSGLAAGEVRQEGVDPSQFRGRHTRQPNDLAHDRQWEKERCPGPSNPRRRRESTRSVGN
ncbi:hypothetical protein ACF1FX_24960 [Streptomyces sp. NPDC014646]|uniref:hypothetical protein n=1 Tax=unclassified Streptomyces TaxID=2593676 RepID=UPI0036FE474F